MDFNTKDCYSKEKMERFKTRFPELTFTIYLKLSLYGLTDTEIKRMYQIGTNNFQFFKNNHQEVLKELRGWI